MGELWTLLTPRKKKLLDLSKQKLTSSASTLSLRQRTGAAADSGEGEHGGYSRRGGDADAALPPHALRPHLSDPIDWLGGIRAPQQRVDPPATRGGACTIQLPSGKQAPSFPPALSARGLPRPPNRPLRALPKPTPVRMETLGRRSERHAQACHGGPCGPPCTHRVHRSPVVFSPSPPAAFNSKRRGTSHDTGVNAPVCFPPEVSSPRGSRSLTGTNGNTHAWRGTDCPRDSGG